MGESKKMVALDCGNSSYRLVLGTYENNRLKMEVVAQEKNTMVKVKDLYYWNILKMYEFLIKNLKLLVKRGDCPDSIGICTWGVDFAFFDKEGYQLGDALSYRNTLGEKVLENIKKEDQKKLFMKTGILCNRINSIYLLTAMKDAMPSKFLACEHILMMPDIFNYLLTGVMINEPSELSTTQLFNSETKTLDLWACDFFGLSPTLFSGIGEHGKKIGELLPSIKEEIGIEGDLPVICVPSHDTAAAVTAIPAEDEFLFISSGTWALIGAELNQPIINEKVLKAELTNETGAYNKTTLLKNSTGMFILERMKEELEEEKGKKISWGSFLEMETEDECHKSIEVNDERYFNPPHMGRILQKTIMGEEHDEINWGLLIKVVQRSMAINYANTISDLEDIIGSKFNNIYIVGGGAKNTRINQLTAEFTNKNIIACGNESTCLGNLGVQLNYFYPKLNLASIRKIIKNSIEMTIYKPIDKG